MLIFIAAGAMATITVIAVVFPFHGLPEILVS